MKLAENVLIASKADADCGHSESLKPIGGSIEEYRRRSLIANANVAKGRENAARTSSLPKTAHILE